MNKKNFPDDLSFDVNFDEIEVTPIPESNNFAQNDTAYPIYYDNQQSYVYNEMANQEWQNYSYPSAYETQNSERTHYQQNNNYLHYPQRETFTYSDAFSSNFNEYNQQAIYQDEQYYPDSSLSDNAVNSRYSNYHTNTFLSQGTNHSAINQTRLQHVNYDKSSITTSSYYKELETPEFGFSKEAIASFTQEPLPEKGGKKKELKPLSISSILDKLQNTLELQYSGVYLEAEISTISFSGRHAYLTLKDIDDAKAILSAVLWDYQVNLAEFASKCFCQPGDFKNGAKVELHGKITVYKATGKMQLKINKMRLAGGVGIHIQRIEQTRQWIIANNLHALERKRPIPVFPRAVGLVTSSKAAGLKDMLHVFNEQAPDVKLIIYECNVQGDLAVNSIVDALVLANQENRVDVIICGRGGGAAEDLLAFSEQKVVLAVAQSQIPVISAVGHEIDNPLTDLVADAYATTPTKAAVLIAAPRVRLRHDLVIYRNRLQQAIENYFKQREYYLQNLEQQVSLLDPRRIIENIRIQLQNNKSYLDTQVAAKLERNENIINFQTSKLNNILQNYFTYYGNFLAHTRQRVEQCSPDSIFQSYWRKVDELQHRMQYCLAIYLNSKVEDINNLAYQLPIKINNHFYNLIQNIADLKQRVLRYNPRYLLQNKYYELQQLTQRLYSIVKQKVDMYSNCLDSLDKRLAVSIQRKYEDKLKNSAYLMQRVYTLNPLQKINEKAMIVQQLSQKAVNLAERKINNKVLDLENLLHRTKALDPYLPLKRGYAMVMDENNTLITSVQQMQANPQFIVHFYDGVAQVETKQLDMRNSSLQINHQEELFGKLQALIDSLKLN